jgi:hypothetical protein
MVEQIHDKFHYGEEPLEDDKVAPIERVKVERMVGIPTEPNDSLERYKNVRSKIS